MYEQSSPLDCYDAHGNLYHPKINPADFNKNGHLLSEETIEKFRNLYTENGSPASFRIPKKKHPELFSEGETPRSALFMNGCLFILYRDLANKKFKSYLGKRPAKDSKQREMPELYKSNGKLIKPEDNVKLAWDVDNKRFVAIRVTLELHLDQNKPPALEKQGMIHEREALKKLGRLYGEMLRQKQVIAQKYSDEDRTEPMTFNVIYSAEKLIRGKPLDAFLNNQDKSFEEKLQTTIFALKELQEIHDHNVVHEDVWALHNFLYDDVYKEVFLMDFEMAKVKDFAGVSQKDIEQYIINENFSALNAMLSSLLKYAPKEIADNLLKLEEHVLMSKNAKNEDIKNLGYFITKLSALLPNRLVNKQ